MQSGRNVGLQLCPELTGKLPRSLAPRDLVRVLDVASQLIDADYVSRAKDAKTHFHDGTSNMSTVVRRAALGDLDNALAQLLAHHARSMQLALRSRLESGKQRDRTRAEALLEHAFALHFIEDGLAGGHVVTDRSYGLPEPKIVTRPLSVVTKASKPPWRRGISGARVVAMPSPLNPSKSVPSAL